MSSVEIYKPTIAPSSTAKSWLDTVRPRDLRLVRVDDKNRHRFHTQLSELESLATYPLGQDRFRIDHGTDYFRFFERMGRVIYIAALDSRDRVVGAACGVRRLVEPRPGARPVPVWYGCDLKIHPEYRRQRIPLWMAARAIFRHFHEYLGCPRGYGVTMNPPDGPNPVVGLLQRFPWLSVDASAILGIFSFDAFAMREIDPVVAIHRGPVTYLSHSGVKDIVLASTGQPMPLLHAQFGRSAECHFTTPQPDHVHMISVPNRDPLYRALLDRGHSPSATATVVSHRMRGFDFGFILTSDI